MRMRLEKMLTYIQQLRSLRTQYGSIAPPFLSTDIWTESDSFKCGRCNKIFIKFNQYITHTENCENESSDNLWDELLCSDHV